MSARQHRRSRGERPSGRSIRGESSHAPARGPRPYQHAPDLSLLANMTSLTICQTPQHPPNQASARYSRQDNLPAPRATEEAPAMSLEEEEELIELVALNFAATEAQQQCFGRRFVANKTFRDRVLAVDEMYRSRRTLYDYHHAGCLRECVMLTSSMLNTLHYFPNDDELRTACLSVERATERVRADQDTTGLQILALCPEMNYLHLLTGVDGNPSLLPEMELTTTSAGARVAAAQFEERERSRMRRLLRTASSNPASLPVARAAAVSSMQPTASSERAQSRGIAGSSATNVRAPSHSSESVRTRGSPNSSCGPNSTQSGSSSSSDGGRGGARGTERASDHLWKGMFKRK